MDPTSAVVKGGGGDRKGNPLTAACAPILVY